MSFDDLVRSHRGEILAYLVRVLGNRDDAEDACQDALMRAYGAFGRLDRHANVRAWLYRIATRSALNALRSRKRRGARHVDVNVDLLPARSITSVAQRERLGIVVRAVNGLPPKQRAALMQRQFHGLTYDEIAASVGCSPAAARANVYQAIKKLRQLLDDRAQKESDQ